MKGKKKRPSSCQETSLDQEYFFQENPFSYINCICTQRLFSPLFFKERKKFSGGSYGQILFNKMKKSLVSLSSLVRGKKRSGVKRNQITASPIFFRFFLQRKYMELCSCQQENDVMNIQRKKWEMSSRTNADYEKNGIKVQLA